MRALKLLLLLVVVAGVIYLAVNYAGSSGSGTTAQDRGQADQKAKQEAPPLEERYGFTGESVGP